MIRNQFKNVKIGGIFTNADSFMFFRKMSNQECRAVRMSHDGKWRAIRNTSMIWWMQPSDVVHFKSINEHDANIKFSGAQTNKQIAQRQRFMQLGTLYRVKSNLKTIATDHGAKLNLVQMKKLEEATMVINWVIKQVRGL